MFIKSVKYFINNFKSYVCYKKKYKVSFYNKIEYFLALKQFARVVLLNP